MNLSCLKDGVNFSVSMFRQEARALSRRTLIRTSNKPHWNELYMKRCSCWSAREELRLYFLNPSSACVSRGVLISRVLSLSFRDLCAPAPKRGRPLLRSSVSVLSFILLTTSDRVFFPPKTDQMCPIRSRFFSVFSTLSCYLTEI